MVENKKEIIKVEINAHQKIISKVSTACDNNEMHVWCILLTIDGIVDFIYFEKVLNEIR